MKNLVVSDLPTRAGRFQVESRAQNSVRLSPLNRAAGNNLPIVPGVQTLGGEIRLLLRMIVGGWTAPAPERSRLPRLPLNVLAAAPLLFLLFTGVAASAQTVTLAWDPNPEPDVVGYRLYYGPASRSFTNSVDAVANETRATASGLVRGETYFFFVTAFNDLGLESGQSLEIFYTVPDPLTNAPPVADNATIQGREDTPVQVTLTGNDPDGQAIRYRLLSGPLRGTISGNPPQLTYTPALNFFGTDRFSFEVQDGFTNSPPATVAIMVSPVNDTPTLDVIPNLIIGTNAGSQVVALTGIGSGAGNETATLTVTARSNVPDLIPDLTVTYESPAANGALILTPNADARGTATITVTVDDGESENGIFSRSFDVVIGIESSPTVYLQAESALLRAPMIVAEDTNASNGQYVYSSVSQQGTITFPVVVPRAADYTIWCRVLSTNGSTDSFFVSVDGGAEDIYDTAEGTWSTNWQWTRVNGRLANGLQVPPLPRILNLSQGAHSLIFRGRDPATRLDAICITADPTFVPPTTTAGPHAPPQLLTPVMAAPGTVTVKFQAPGESRYEFQVSEDFQWWSSLWQSPPAAKDEWVQFIDLEVTPSGRRFYRVMVLTN